MLEINVEVKQILYKLDWKLKQILYMLVSREKKLNENWGINAARILEIIRLPV